MAEATPKPAAPRLTFPRRLRLTHAREFDAVRRSGVRRQAHPLAISGRPNGLPHCRLGLSVGRPVGNAVVRNRAKRHIREAFRLSQRDFPIGTGGGYDLVVAVRPHDELPFADYRKILLDLAAAIHREWDRRGASNPPKTKLPNGK
jgi:ribonuclease P protein component